VNMKNPFKKFTFVFASTFVIVFFLISLEQKKEIIASETSKFTITIFPPVPPPGPGGGTGGGGGGGGTALPDTGVVFSGRAYPLSKVVILKDGQIAAETIAGTDARFRATLRGLSEGN